MIEIENKLNDFIIMYKAIIKHCLNKKRNYNIKLKNLKNILQFTIIDDDSQNIIHNDNISCTKEEATIIYNSIIKHFILIQELEYITFLPMKPNDVLEYIGTGNGTITCNNKNYYNNNQMMITYILKGTYLTLNINFYEDIDNNIKILHQTAADKLNKYKEKNRTIM